MQEEHELQPEEHMPPREPGFGRKFLREVWEFAKIVIISLAIVLPIRLFIAQPFIVQGASMQPTFQSGEYLIVDEISYRFNEPKRGDVIVFRYPEDPSQFFIKRIIGLPLETLIIQEGTVRIQNTANPDGMPLEEVYLPHNLATAPNLEITLEDGEYFVLGDNRTHSKDSRHWGVLKEDLLIGRAILRLWPVTDLGLVTGL